MAKLTNLSTMDRLALEDAIVTASGVPLSAAHDIVERVVGPEIDRRVQAALTAGRDES